jgi:glutamate racemase
MFGRQRDIHDGHSQDRRPAFRGAVGVLDSGIGGLTILRSLEKTLPNEKFIYLADNARFPYGDKSSKEIKRNGLELAAFLDDHGVKAIILACGTLSCYALEPIFNEFRLPTFGVIEPTVREITKWDGKTTLVWATPATIDSGQYQHKLKHRKKVSYQSQPNLALNIENNIPMNLIESNCELLALGCTHYSWLRFNQRTIAVDSAFELSKEVKAWLHDEHLLSKQKTAASEFYFTGAVSEKTRELIESNFGQTSIKGETNVFSPR